MKTIALTVFAAAAGLAFANPIESPEIIDNAPSTHNGGDGIMIIDVSGYRFNDFQGSELNEIIDLFVGQDVLPHRTHIVGIAWDVDLTTIGNSWASDISIRIRGGFNQLFLDFAQGDDFGVTNQNYNSDGFIYLKDLGFSDFVPDQHGFFEIEFFETFVDNDGTGDAFFEAGSTITITSIFPTPGTLAALGLGGLIASRRRR